MRKVLMYLNIRWIAVVILLLAYAFVSQGTIDGQGVIYNAMNGLGSILLIISSLLLQPKDWAVAVFNMVWLAIAMVTILHQLFGFG